MSPDRQSRESRESRAAAAVVGSSKGTTGAMSRVPVTGRQATELVKRLAVNRIVGRSAGRGGGGLSLRLPSVLRAPSVPGGVEPLPVESTVGAHYDTEWARSSPVRAARVLLVEGVVRPMMSLLAPPTVKGLDRLHDLDGPVVFAANHHSHVDTPLLLSTIPDPWRHHLFIGAAADYFFGNRATSTLSALVIGAIPIERTKVTRNSADQAAELLDDGWSMLIFPEGGRSPDGWGQAFRGRRRLPVAALPRAGGAHPRGGHRAGAEQGHERASPDADRRHLRDPAGAGRRRGLAAAGCSHRGRRWRRWRTRPALTGGRRGRRAATGETPPLQGPANGAWRRTWAPRRSPPRPPPPAAILARPVAYRPPTAPQPASGGRSPPLPGRSASEGLLPPKSPHRRHPGIGSAMVQQTWPAPGARWRAVGAIAAIASLAALAGCSSSNGDGGEDTCAGTTCGDLVVEFRPVLAMVPADTTAEPCPDQLLGRGPPPGPALSSSARTAWSSPPTPWARWPSTAPGWPRPRRPRPRESTGWSTLCCERGPTGSTPSTPQPPRASPRTQAAPRGSSPSWWTGQVVSAPVINAPAFEVDQIQISGDFDRLSAERLAAGLR